MKAIGIVGIVLVLLGVGGLFVNVIPFHHQEQVLKVGPVTATADKENDVPIPPYAGVIAILAGLGLVYAGRRQA